jgi:hypothetical protein
MIEARIGARTGRWRSSYTVQPIEPGPPGFTEDAIPVMMFMLDFMAPLTVGTTATEKTMPDRRPMLSPSRAATMGRAGLTSQWDNS